MRVSIVINNYNYASFVGQAIESALAQSYPDTEVIVVDDGSTDGSRGVIEGYGEAITTVYKANGGQASAIDAGFEACGGEVVIFLDADDVLVGDAVGRVVEVFEGDPSVAKVQWRLEEVDAQGMPVGVTVPTNQRCMPQGDLREHIKRFRSYPRSPMSGNAFPSWVLREILPMDEELYRINADLYLSDLSPLYGPVVSLSEPASLYRVHGKNNYRSTRAIDRWRLRNAILYADYNRHLQRRTLGLSPGQKVGRWDLLDLRNRVTYRRLFPEDYPFNERLAGLCARGMVAAAIFPEVRYTPLKRLGISLWFAAMLGAPRPLAARLAGELLYPSGGGMGTRISALLSGLRIKDKRGVAGS